MGILRFYERMENQRDGDMYTDKSLLPLFHELVGISGHKPFECVGTNEEILWSMYRSILQSKDSPLPPILKDIEEKAIKFMSESYWEDLEKKLFHEYENNIPLIFKQ